MIYADGTGNWTKINHRGKPILKDEFARTEIGYFQHIYMYGWMKPSVHACLRSGWFCWSDLMEHPQDLFKYIYAKLS